MDVTVALAPSVEAQSVNVDCGPALAIAPTYGAGAGQAGPWNQLHAGGPTVGLLDLAGQPTGVLAIPWGGCDESACGGCSPQGCVGLSGGADDLALLGSWMNGNCVGQEEIVALHNLAPGRYALRVEAQLRGNNNDAKPVARETLITIVP